MLGFPSRLSAAFLLIVFGLADVLVGGGSEEILVKFTASFLSSALIFPIFYIPAYFLLKQQRPL